MPATLEDIESQALALSNQDRAELADRLVASLAGAEPSNTQQAWYDLAKARRDEIRCGTVQGVPGEEVLAHVRALVGR